MAISHNFKHVLSAFLLLVHTIGCASQPVVFDLNITGVFIDSVGIVNLTAVQPADATNTVLSLCSVPGLRLSSSPEVSSVWLDQTIYIADGNFNIFSIDVPNKPNSSGICSLHNSSRDG